MTMEGVVTTPRCLGRLRAVAGGLRVGRLTVIGPEGDRWTFSGSRSGPEATLRIHHRRLGRRLALGGALGLAESYIDGDWDSDDLPALLEMGAWHGDRLPGGRATAWLHRLIHRLRPNSRRGSRRNIAAHYDLGNGFYGAWLDASMTYSAALYGGADLSLEAAQAAKRARVADLLALPAGARVLEIGCGWGALAADLTERGARVTGITLSRAQFDHAARLLGPAADIRLQDYRDVTGRFDAIASVEMIEAVGEAHWPAFFRTLRDRLLPGGAAVIQAITIADDRFARYRRGTDFIQRHIFPGGMLPSPGVIRDQAERAGLVVDHVETFGADYARTLLAWRQRFHAAWPRLAAMGFDGRFRRLWDYYLCYCAAGFRAGTIDVGLWRLRLPA